jgi:drug/metabolite transporter (DMT)-like permease
MHITQQINRAMTPIEWALLITLSILWGGSFFFNGVAVKELPTLTVVVARVVLAAIILWFVLAVLRISMPKKRSIWAAFFGMGLLNNVIPFSLIVWGQSHIASGLASILNATTPLFTVIIAHWFTADEKMTGRHFIGILIGFIGVAVMIGPDAIASLGLNVVAQLTCLAATVSYAFAGIFGRRFHAMGITPMATATGQVTASSIVLIPIMLIVDEPWTLTIPSTRAMFAIIGVAALSTALAYIIYFRVLATAGATNLLLVTFLIPVSAILLGSTVLGEALMTKHYGGMALIGVGLAAIDGRLLTMISTAFGCNTAPQRSYSDGDGV